MVNWLTLLYQDQFNLILKSAHNTQAYLFADGTRKNIRSHIRQFILFCVKFQRCIIPADRETLVAFFELFSLTASYEHLKNVYSSIKFLHKALNFSFLEDEFQVDTVLQSVKRKLARFRSRFYQLLQIYWLQCIATSASTTQQI